MRRISDRKIAVAFLAVSLVFLASCASPKPTPTAYVQQQPADAFDKYESVTDYSRCRLFTSADGWRFIPEIGVAADLDTQIRCAPVRTDLTAYAECVGGRAVAVAVAPDTGAAGLTSRDPIRVEPIGPNVAVARSNPTDNSGLTEDLDAAWRTWTPPRIEPAAPPTIARIVPRAPTVTTPEQSTRGSPLCAENGSCYGDISSLTGRPKTVSVSGYYRKDGTYVRGHYRSRPRR